MDLVRRLGLRYLWIDSLCIIQSSKRSWGLNSRVTNLIHGNAFLTICTADGSDAWFGLKALGSSGHSTSQHIEECRKSDMPLLHLLIVTYVPPFA
jgi:hypothetical protein